MSAPAVAVSHGGAAVAGRCRGARAAVQYVIRDRYTPAAEPEVNQGNRRQVWSAGDSCAAAGGA